MIPAAELLRSLRSAPDGTVRNLSPTLWSVVAVEDPPVSAEPLAHSLECCCSIGSVCQPEPLAHSLECCCSRGSLQPNSLDSNSYSPSAEGDPHITTITGEKFDLWKMGWSTFMQMAVLDVNSLLTGLHLLLTSLRVTSWWEHVDTHANPADGGSRQGTSCKLAKRLGIPLEWVKFPFVPACMAAAGPTNG